MLDGGRSASGAAMNLYIKNMDSTSEERSMTSLTDELFSPTWHTLFYTINLFLQSSLVVSVKIVVLDTKCGGRSCKEMYSATSCGQDQGTQPGARTRLVIWSTPICGRTIRFGD